MGFRNWLNFILCSTVIFCVLKFVPFFYDIFTAISVFFVGTKLAEWMMSVTRKYVLHKTVPSKNKAVLITGCGAGFGNALARRMDQLGYRVFAACRSPDRDDAKDLAARTSDRLTVMPINVTDEQSVQEAKEFVAKNLGQYELWALVNNAGIAQAGEVDWSTLEDFQAPYNVNTAGVLRVTKAFLPLLKKSKGRIVNINSFASRVTAAGCVGYCMSKSAALSLTTGMRIELGKWGVKVVSIEPFFYSTKMIGRNSISEMTDRTWENAPQDVKQQYGEEYRKLFEKNLAVCISIFRSPKSYEVIDCMEDAITSKDPLPVYSPGQFLGKNLCKCIHLLPTDIGDFFQRYILERKNKPAALNPKKYRRD